MLLLSLYYADVLQSQKLDRINLRTKRLEVLTAGGTQSICSQLADVAFVHQQNHQSQQLAISQVDNRVQALQKLLEDDSSQELPERPSLQYPKGSPHRSLMAAPVRWLPLSESDSEAAFKVKVHQTLDFGAEIEQTIPRPWQFEVTVTSGPESQDYVFKAWGNQTNRLALRRTGPIPVPTNHNISLPGAIVQNAFPALLILFEALLIPTVMLLCRIIPEPKPKPEAKSLLPFRSYLTELALRARGYFKHVHVQTILFDRSIQWEMEDFHRSDIWAIGMLANADDRIRTDLQELLCGFRSPPYFTKAQQQILQACFDVDIVIAQVKNASHIERSMFLEAISYSGTSSMLIPFIHAGVDVNEGDLLGSAAVGGHYDTCQILLENGANTAPAISSLLEQNYNLRDKDFRRFLALLVDSSPIPTGEVKRGKTLQNILRSWRVRKLYSQAADAFLVDQFIDDRMLYGSDDIFAEESYMCLAITHDWFTVLDHLLNQAVPLDVLIGHAFPREGHSSGAQAPLKEFTWLTLAIELGRVDCVSTLVKHGADIFFMDGLERTPLQLSRDRTAGKHPRMPTNAWLHMRTPSAWKVNLSADEHVLALLEAALAGLSLDKAATTAHLKASVRMRSPESGTPNIASNAWSRTVRCINEFPPISALERLVQNLQFELYWHVKLTFQQALSVRLIDVESSLILFALETTALIYGLQRDTILCGLQCGLIVMFFAFLVLYGTIICKPPPVYEPSWYGWARGLDELTQRMMNWVNPIGRYIGLG